MERNAYIGLVGEYYHPSWNQISLDQGFLEKPKVLPDIHLLNSPI